MQFMSGLPRAAEAACAEALYQCLSIVFGRCFAFFLPSPECAEALIFEVLLQRMSSVLA